MATLTLALAALLQAAAPSPQPSPSPSPRRIADSVEKVVERLEAERKDPCLKAARENVPCFPARTERKGYDASVRQSLGLPDPSPDKPTPGSPTRDEMDEHRTVQMSKPAVSVTIDPVCAVKSGLKKLRGRNDKYFLYRVRDVHGERVVLLDRRMDASRFQGEVAFLGEFNGECEAQAAYRREQRRSPPPSPAP